MVIKSKKAEIALKWYKGYKGKDPLEDRAIAKELERLQAVQNEQKITENLRLSDFCTYLTSNSLVAYF